MIKKIEVYQTTDGKRFDSLKEAETYEAYYEKCQKIMKNLRRMEGYGAVQQDLEVVKKAFADFMDFCSEVIPNFKWMFNEVKNGTRHVSHVEKVVSDYETSFPFLWKALCRFTSISHNNGVEYNQPYYATHENEWKYEIK